MEDAFIVHGGAPLVGEVSMSGAKNVALKVLVAALLYKTPVTFTNIPNIEDVKELLHLLSLLGATIKQSDNTVTIDPSTLSLDEVDLLHGSKIRVSFMLFAPLLYRFGKAKIPNPGGCRLGARPIDRHISMLRSFGVTINYNSENGYYTASTDGSIKGCTFTFKIKTHTGTELAILMATLAQGESVIENAAQEPEIDDLIQFLNQSGAMIKRSGESIHITGVASLSAPDRYEIMNDELEGVTFAVFALATKGDILVKNLSRKHIKDFLDVVQKAGGGIEYLNDGIRFFYKGQLTGTSVTTVPYPGFRTDWQSQWAIIMTQAQGESTIHETIFENKFGYVDELRKVGAKIDFYQPEVENPDALYQFTLTSELKESLQQAIRVQGPTKLHNGVLIVRDIRAGATVLIAACMAEGESVVQGAAIIDRGYENIEDKLSKLGAHITRA